MLKSLPPLITYLANGDTWEPSSKVVPIEVGRAAGWYGVVVQCEACLHRRVACLMVTKIKGSVQKRRLRNLQCLGCGKKRAKVFESYPIEGKTSTIP